MPQITQIQVRRDTASSWTSVNPTLAAGEIGFETDTGKFKIGTGSSTWTNLTYATDASKLTGAITAASATNVTGTVAVANGGTGKTTFGATAGVVKSNGSDVLSTATIVDADVASNAAIAPSKISGTATTLTQQRTKFYQGANTLDVPSRLFATSTAAVTTGLLRNFFFTPEQDITVTKISNYVSNATVATWAAPTTSLSRETSSSLNTSTNTAGSAGTSGTFTITMSNNTTSWSAGAPVVGATISGTGIAAGAVVIASAGLVITVDIAHTGRVSGTITISSNGSSGAQNASTVTMVNTQWQTGSVPTVGATISGTGIAAGAKITNITGLVFTLDTPNTGAVSGVITVSSNVSSGVQGTSTITMTNNFWTSGAPFPNNIVSGTGIAAGAKIVSVSSNGLVITLDTPNTGTVSGVITLSQIAAARAALFSVSGLTTTPIATSAWQNYPFVGGTTLLYDFTIPSTTLTAGTTYAVGMVVNWGGTPTLPSLAIWPNANGNLSSGAYLPQITQQAVTTDIVTTTSGTGIASPWFFRLS